MINAYEFLKKSGIKKLSSLTREELAEAFNHNRKLKSIGRDIAYGRTVTLWEEEYLHHFDTDCADFHLGCDRSSYIKVYDPRKFVRGCLNLEIFFGFFDDETLKTLDKATGLSQNDDEWSEEQIKELADTLAETMVEYSNEEFEDALSNLDTAREEFIGEAENGVSLEDWYVDDDYVCYELYYKAHH